MAEQADPIDTPEASGAEPSLKPGLMANRLSFRVRGLLTLLGDRVVKAFAPYGLRSGSFTTMALIAANPGCSQIDLARVGGLDRSSLVGIVDDLEKRGYAIRARSMVDRRRSSLFLTPEGEKVMNEMFVVAMATEKSIRDAFTAEEMAQFFDLLERAYTIIAREDRPED
jgi:DNA-binding MarR family transcriptional regulator